MHRLLIASSLIALLAGAAQADPLLDAVRAKAGATSADGQLYTFDMSYDDGDTSILMKVDQSQPEGQRVVAMTPEPASLEGDAAKLAEMLKTRTKGDIWCSTFAKNIPADAARTAESETAVTYAFTPVPDDEAGQFAKAFKYLSGKAVIDKASAEILSFEMIAPKAFKPMMVAKIDQFDMRVACAAAPDGRTHIADFSMKLSGKAMMQTLDQIERRTVTKLAALSPSGTGSK